MTRRQAWVLVAAAAWTFYVWITRIAVIIGDHHSRAFKVVHIVLAAVSIAFGIAILVIGARVVRRSPVTTRESTPTR